MNGDEGGDKYMEQKTKNIDFFTVFLKIFAVRVDMKYGYPQC